MDRLTGSFSFIFDSGRLESYFYGEVVFEYMLKGRELTNNPSTAIISLGDIIIWRRYIDIEPYVIKDEYCTLDFDALTSNSPFKDLPFCWVIDNLSAEIACSIDKRLKKELNGYVGLSRVDKVNILERKQFWKHTIKRFSLHADTITCFQDPELEGEFVHSDIAKQLGYKVEYAAPFDEESEDQQLYEIDKPNKEKPLSKDVDRDLWTLNFSIRQELQISGALLWKAINALDKVRFNAFGEPNEHLVEYPFLTLYLSSQGIERIQKAIVELVCKKNHIQENEKKQVYDLLTSHAHDRLNNWIEEQENIKVNSNCRKLIDILTRFYNTVRYARYADESYLRSTTPEYDLLLELKNAKNTDLNADIKNGFGNYLGQLAGTYFKVFNKLCSELNIFAYELEYDSPACIVYGNGEKPKNLYREFRNRQMAKKELLYWLMKQSQDYPKSSVINTEAPLDFDAESIEHYLWELIFNPEDGQDCFDEVDCLYDELCSLDKDKWKNHLDLMNYLFSDR